MYVVDRPKIMLSLQRRAILQGSRKVWKSGGGLVVLGGENVPPPDWDRVNWSAKKRAPQPPPLLATALTTTNYTSWPQCGNLSPKFVFYISMFNVVLSFWFDDWIISIISGSNKYRISSYKARGNYFFNCLLFKGQVNKFAGIIIQGRTLNEEKRYMKIFHPVQGQPLGIVIK